MSVNLWAVEELVRDMTLLDAYCLLRSLGFSEEWLTISGHKNRIRVQDVVRSNPKLAMQRMDIITLATAFPGGPERDKTFVLPLRSYIADRILYSMRMRGRKVVADLINEITYKPLDKLAECDSITT
jgi:hypothetical protein